MNSRTCPVCGKSKSQFVDTICLDCFLDKNPISFPLQVEFAYCPSCNKVLSKGKWTQSSDAVFLELVTRALRHPNLSDASVDGKLQTDEHNETHFVGTVKGKVRGAEVSLPVSVELSEKSELCRACSLIRADYYQAKIQLRFESKDKEEWLRVLGILESRMDVLFTQDSLSQISKKVRVSNGFDVWVGSKHAAKTVVSELSKKFRIKPVSSFTLAGVDSSGREKKTFTFLLRFGP